MEKLQKLIYRFTEKPDYLLLNSREYLKRLLRTSTWILFLFVILATIATTAVLFLSKIINGANIGELAKSAGAAAISASIPTDERGLLYSPESINEPSAESNYCVFIVFAIEALIVSVLGFVFSGWFAKVFLTPINTIKFSPFVILKENALTFRIWICQHSGNYLNDVKVTIGYQFEGMFDNSVLLLCDDEERTSEGNVLSSRIEGSESADSRILPAKHKLGFTSIYIKEYPSMLGAWDIKVPLKSYSANYLLDVFEGHIMHKFEDHKMPKPAIRLTICGMTSSGEIISKTASYDIYRILTGYHFAQYHDSQWAQEQNNNRIAKIKNKCHMWFGNIVSVIKDVDAEHVEDNAVPNKGNIVLLGSSGYFQRWSRLTVSDEKLKNQHDEAVRYFLNAKQLDDASQKEKYIEMIKQWEKRKDLLNKYSRGEIIVWDARLTLKQIGMFYSLDKDITE